MSMAIPLARLRLRLTKIISLATPLVRVAKVHAAPTAPAPIMPVFMIDPRRLTVIDGSLWGKLCTTVAVWLHYFSRPCPQGQHCGRCSDVGLPDVNGTPYFASSHRSG